VQEDRPLAARAWSSACASPCRPPRRPAVDLQRLHAERLGALGDVADRRVLRSGVDSAHLLSSQHEHRRHLPELREVERLVERADVRRAVAEERDGDARLAAHLNASAAPVICGRPPPTTAFAPMFPRSTS
jgi:hypothetical protein